MKQYFRSLSLVFFTFSFQGLWAQVISPRASELHFQLAAEFLSAPEEGTDDPKALAENHLSHLFGLMHSPTKVLEVGVKPNLIEGLGGILIPSSIEILSQIEEGSSLKIRYRAQGRMLVVKEAAKKWLRRGYTELPMPYDMAKIYDISCTDEHYSDPSDYWYFYDPFRKTCTYLLGAGYAKNTRIDVSAVEAPAESTSAGFDILRAENGNGAVFSVYYIQGFSDDRPSKNDDGRQAFNNTRKFLQKEGFVEKIITNDPRRPQVQLYKNVSDPHGKPVQLVVNALLVNTDITSRGKSFAKFFREAVYDADFLLYAGHSGLGGNLDIPSLEEKAGVFKFNDSKKQVFYFESCSSYSYYLDHFRHRKSRGKLSIISNGLSSYFEEENTSMNTMLAELFNLKSNPTWLHFLKKIEKPLEGRSYLINVGL